MAAVLSVPAGWLWLRILTGNGVDLTRLRLPAVDPFLLIVGIFFLVLIGTLLGTTVVAGRSPHLTYRPEQIGTRFDDVQGIDAVKAEVIRSLNLFLAHHSFAKQMGGTFAGSAVRRLPGTGKTYVARAMAAEAEVRFCSSARRRSSPCTTGRRLEKIWSYFKALRKTARKEGGAIGFIEGDRRHRHRAAGCRRAPRSHILWPNAEGLSACPVWVVTSPDRWSTPRSSAKAPGVVNELLVQMQSFDEPTGFQRFISSIIGRINLLLPAHRQIPRPKPPSDNVLLIAATNRAAALDPR